VKAVALCLLLALPAQAQQLVDLKAARLHQVDGGVVDVAGGAWADDDWLIGAAKERADLKTTNAELVKHAPDLPTRWVVGSFIAGVVLGGVATGLVVAFTRR